MAAFTEPFQYYLPPDARLIRSAMTEGLIVPDTNVLLSAYRFAPAAREELIRVLGRVADRLWIPNRAAEEFHRNRLDVIFDYDAAYIPVIDALKAAQTDIDVELRPKVGQLANRAALSNADRDALTRLVGSCTEAAGAAVEKLRTEHGLSRSSTDDEILIQLQKLFDGNTGEPLPADQLEAAVVEAKRRAEKQIPPGYRDAGKTEPYGDYLVWKQTLREVARRKIPYLVFLTLDSKEDWYWIIKGRTISARPELARELKEECGSQLVMLNVASFLFHAREYLDAEVSAETIRQSQNLPKADLDARRDRARHRMSNMDRLTKRITDRRAFIKVLQDALDERRIEDPDALTIETRVLQTQLEHQQLTERVLSRRLTRLQQNEASDGGEPVHDAPSRSLRNSNENRGPEPSEAELDLDEAGDEAIPSD
jgi:hypothetical protein